MKFFLSLIAIATGLASASQAQSLTKVRVAFDGYSMTSAPLHYADQQGIFKQFGLDVKPIFVEGGSLLTQAVVREDQLNDGHSTTQKSGITAMSRIWAWTNWPSSAVRCVESTVTATRSSSVSTVGLL